MESYFDQMVGEIVKLDAQYQSPIEEVIVILHRDTAWKIDMQRPRYITDNPCLWEVDGYKLQIIRTTDLLKHQSIIISSCGVHKYNFKDEPDKNTLP